MANVLKVFLENGQTKSFKYDTTTTVAVSTISNNQCEKFRWEKSFYRKQK